MTHPIFTIDLSNFVFKNQNLKDNMTVTASEPQMCRFLDRKNHPPKDQKGVYLIFSPETIDYSSEGNGCVYVGEGNINKRLYNHNYKKRFIKDTNYKVIYYIIDEQKDRKAFERILIKYYDPTFNKEGTSKLVQLNQHSADIEKIKDLARRLESRFEDVRYKGTKYYDELFDFTSVVVRMLEDGHNVEEINLGINEDENESLHESEKIAKIAKRCRLDDEEVLRQLFENDN
ncbi:hypothetical protein COI68_23560 [Priestia megaterium]|uniref:GIY-YIG nuclease family protein n=1 Tax=Priestia megaterium TaxID=1404 RepID=UPI000BF3BBEE|nr:GIY-YIG nuclease family protein [Priestia megaterium]PFI61843.1 hypothetical protein COI68_23560 [Priestia megaterium]